MPGITISLKVPIFKRVLKGRASTQVHESPVHPGSHSGYCQIIPETACQKNCHSDGSSRCPSSGLAPRAGKARTPIAREIRVGNSPCDILLFDFSFTFVNGAHRRGAGFLRQGWCLPGRVRFDRLGGAFRWLWLRKWLSGAGSPIEARGRSGDGPVFGLLRRTMCLGLAGFPGAMWED